MYARYVLVHRVEDHLAGLGVRLVVGELDLVEDDLVLHPVQAGVRRVRVHVDVARAGGGLGRCWRR